ncbi:MAG: PhoD-like phosphatase N-terminal domain-containing protein, partial [Candidatus Dadabacteria bacterium]|nr:PhoD-like phosphatase N-terminal domain-containing protein [Candidatus Dadabacteria bacterium]
MFSGKPIVYAAALLLLALLLGAVAFFLYSGSGKVSFNHGVASGDPLADRVILWTRVTPQASGKQVRVRVEVAKEPGFKSIVKSLIATASAESDYTVKVDVDGLHAGAVYYYRFRSGGVTSPVGRTKTLPRGDVNSVRLAVFSCANYPASHGGYFNVYGHAAKTASTCAVFA